MIDTKEVKTSIGTFTLIKPKAGVRNRALIKAETDSGTVRRIVFLTEIIPHMVNKRPEGIDQDVNIHQILDGLEIEDYDLLVDAADELANAVKTKEEEIQKKT